MTCFFCEFDWCWKCGGTVDEFHYVPGNPFNCGVGMMDSDAPDYKRYLSLVLQLLGFGLFVMATPMVLVFTIPFGLFIMVWSFYFAITVNKGDLLLGVLLFLPAFIGSLIMLILGFAFDIIAIPLALLLVPLIPIFGLSFTFYE
jgi:hypothetical protein